MLRHRAREPGPHAEAGRKGVVAAADISHPEPRREGVFGFGLGGESISHAGGDAKEETVVPREVEGRNDGESRARELLRLALADSELGEEDTASRRRHRGAG